MIEDTQQPVIVPFEVDGDGQVVRSPTADRALNDLLAVDPAPRVGAIARRLQPYLVQLPAAGFAVLRALGAVQPVQPERYGEQFMRLMLPGHYDARFGVRLEAQAAQAAENNIW
jgi:CRISPR-associated endonuclease/helicase Cas3